MKKLLSLLGVLIIIGCLQANAEKSGVYMDFTSMVTKAKTQQFIVLL